MHISGLVWLSNRLAAWEVHPVAKGSKMGVSVGVIYGLSSRISYYYSVISGFFRSLLRYHSQHPLRPWVPIHREPFDRLKVIGKVPVDRSYGKARWPKSRRLG